MANSILHNGIHCLTPKHGCSPGDVILLSSSLQPSWGLVNLTPAQYIGANTGLESFREVGEFVPLQVDRQGKVMREVALARFGLPLPDHPGQELEVRVALIRDLRCLVPKEPSSEEEDRPLRWDEKSDGTHEYWLDESWRATPLPASPTEPKLIPIVTTAVEADAVELVHTPTPDAGLPKRMPFEIGLSRLASVPIMVMLKPLSPTPK